MPRHNTTSTPTGACARFILGGKASGNAQASACEVHEVLLTSRLGGGCMRGSCHVLMVHQVSLPGASPNYDVSIVSGLCQYDRCWTCLLTWLSHSRTERGCTIQCDLHLPLARAPFLAALVVEHGIPHRAPAKIIAQEIRISITVVHLIDCASRAENHRVCEVVAGCNHLEGDGLIKVWGQPLRARAFSSGCKAGGYPEARILLEPAMIDQSLS